MAKKSNDFIRELFDTEDSPFEIALTMMSILGRDSAYAACGKVELQLPSKKELQQESTRIGSLLYVPGEAPTLKVCLVHKPEIKGYSPLVHDLSIARALQEQGHSGEEHFPL